MPFAGYDDFDECVRKNRSKKNPKAYCAAIMKKAEAKERSVPKAEIVETRAYDIFDIQEAEFDDDKLEAQITVLREGRSKNRRMYTKKVLRQAVSEGVFNNMRMFIDHSDKPPVKRSVRELVSATGITGYTEDEKGGRITAPVKFFSKDFYDFAKRAREYMGDSISAHLRVSRLRQPDGQILEDVQQIMRGHSVDWVVFPAAGGGIEQFITEAEGAGPVEWNEITADQIKEHAPELYAQLTAKEQVDPPKDPPKEPDDDAEELNKGESVSFEAIEILVEKSVRAERERWEADRAAQKASDDKVSTLVDGTSLPDPTKARIKKGFEDKKFDEKVVKEAIEEARTELKAAGAGPKVTEMGVTAADGGTKKLAGRAEEAVASVFGYKPATEAEKN